MKTSLQVLRTLARLAVPHPGMCGRCARLPELAEALGEPPARVADTLYKLRQAGMAERALRRDGRWRRGWHAVTGAGKALLADPDAECRRGRRVAANERHQRIWRAIRAQRKCTAESLLAVVHDATAPAGTARILRTKITRYLGRLADAGVLTPLQPLRRSNQRYLLVRDLGPLAPVPQPAAGTLWDPNTDRRLPMQEAAR